MLAFQVSGSLPGQREKGRRKTHRDWRLAFLNAIKADWTACGAPTREWGWPHQRWAAGRGFQSTGGGCPDGPVHAWLARAVPSGPRPAAALLPGPRHVPDSNLNAETLGWRGLQGVLQWPSARQYER